MFCDYIYKKSSAQYENKILLIDEDHLEKRTNYCSNFVKHGFEVVRFNDDLTFRIDYEQKLSEPDRKIVVVAESEQYIPYDIRCRLRSYVVSFANLFPRLNADVLRGQRTLNYSLLCSAYQTLYESMRSSSDTELFLRTKVYGAENVNKYLQYACHSLINFAKKASTFKEWFTIAENKARIDVAAVKYDLNIDTAKVNVIFRDYVFGHYGKLSGEVDSDGPVLVSRAMEFMSDHSNKFIIIVMDGMSEFDWRILEPSFDGIIYEKTAVFAMIPTVTSISRQCLLSNKYPSQLIEPWKQSKEKQEFSDCVKKMGYSNHQISYMRGYESDFSSLIRCGAVIINEIDDMVHGQKQGRIGMYNDVSVMAKQGKLATMTRRFLSAGFDVFITADHGNTIRRGMGKLMGTGVEIETKSRCMLVLKDFADKSSLMEKYNLLEFPKTYLPKDYDYLICDVGNSFDAKGEDVVSHGGISLDEGIVPFIKIKAVNNNG